MLGRRRPLDLDIPAGDEHAGLPGLGVRPAWRVEETCPPPPECHCEVAEPVWWPALASALSWPAWAVAQWGVRRVQSLMAHILINKTEEHWGTIAPN